jgi:hypothetical protein
VRRDSTRRFWSSKDKRRAIKPPLTHDELADAEGTAPPNWDELLSHVRAVLAGRAHADAYEKAIEPLLSALFYPGLANPQVQHEIHEGRKRIDITYTNVATSGFFAWLSSHYAAPHVFVECKNYGKDVANPELDQLAGRFSPSRGQFGLLVCRSFEDKELFIRRCRDTAVDARGFVVALDDEDLSLLVQARKKEDVGTQFSVLKERFDQLIM